MKKLSLVLETGKNEIYLDGFVPTKLNSKIGVKNASVYWNHCPPENEVVPKKAIEKE